jgi:predicted RecB family nuclease
MQRVDGRFVYSATDLTNDLECRHLTWLERELAMGARERPAPDATVRLIAEKGDAHEARYRDVLRARHGTDMVAFEQRPENTVAGLTAADAATLAAMASGARIIDQATFFDGTFLGRADFLRRVESPSGNWPWSYEVIDTKLALGAKAHFLLQLCNYSEHIERLQGSAPAFGHLVFGSNVERADRIADYGAFYRHQKRTFLARVAVPDDRYPHEVGHCAVCRWTETCEATRERDDYLGLVAWMRQGQIAKLATEGITSIRTFATARDDQRPFGMTESSFATLRHQARLQQQQRVAFATVPLPEERHFVELLDHEAGRGFEQLPPPAVGDVYFDMEGDPLYAPERGLEYLFGVYLADEHAYRAFWAHSLADERAAFEHFVDLIVERRRRYPQMHVYHYAPYETTALRRLMGVYGTREAEIDDLLRAQVFVDLFAVVRQAVRISQPSYSIKKLEPFYGMVRTTDVRRGDDSIVMFESWLVDRDDAILRDIERYNEDDCVSTWLLHRWLLERRTECENTVGHALAWRPEPEPKKPDDAPAGDLAARLLDGLPAPESEADLRASTENVRLRWLLGNLLHYHRREAKPAWWKLFDRYENVDRLTEFDHEAIGGLSYCNDVAPFKAKPKDRNWVHTFAFPDQQYNLGSGNPYEPYAQKPAGEVIRIDDDANRLQLKVGGELVPAAIRALVPGGPLGTKTHEAALERIARAYDAGVLATTYPAINDLVLRAAPRFRGRARGTRLQPADVMSDAIVALVADLDDSYLFLQGPPGSGKSTKGGEAIAALIAAGKRVGIVSRSHKAVHHLLHKVERAAHARGQQFTGFYKHSNEDDAYVSPLATPMIASTSENAKLEQLPHDLAGGTPWLFTRENLDRAYDVLVIDEAGLLSLGDAIACATAARNVVLLGDPLQLAQVSQGAHPIGTSASVLEHLLGPDHTVRPDRGVFLDVSYRMHPAICGFISASIYDGRLTPGPLTANNRVDAPGVTGAGLRFLPVTHAANGRESPEEADAIADAVAELLRGTVTLFDAPQRALAPPDILIVTPYNAQRRRIAQTLADRGLPPVAVGTVDKFQGQEAPVVFYSMATSSTADMPRDMGFLFEKNRFNVAISRAQCLSIVVCSPELLEARCRTPQDMLLANLLCAFVERAEPIGP